MKVEVKKINKIEILQGKDLKLNFEAIDLENKKIANYVGKFKQEEGKLKMEKGIAYEKFNQKSQKLSKEIRSIETQLLRLLAKDKRRVKLMMNGFLFEKS